jgi:hypothetical protein
MALNISLSSYFTYELPTIQIYSLDNIHSHIHTRPCIDHFVLFAPVYYYIVAFNLLFFLCNVIKNEISVNF